MPKTRKLLRMIATRSYAWQSKSHDNVVIYHHQISIQANLAINICTLRVSVARVMLLSVENSPISSVARKITTNLTFRCSAQKRSAANHMRDVASLSVSIRRSTPTFDSSAVSMAWSRQSRTHPRPDREHQLNWSHARSKTFCIPLRSLLFVDMVVGKGQLHP